MPLQFTAFAFAQRADNYDMATRLVPPTNLRSGRTPDNAEYIRELSARYRRPAGSTQAQAQAARQTNMLESKQKKWSAAAARAVAQANKSEVPDQYWVFEDAGVIADRFLRGVEYLRESLSVLHADRGALLASQHIVGGGKVGAVAAPKGTGVLFGALTAEMKWTRTTARSHVQIPQSLQTGRARWRSRAAAIAAPGIRHRTARRTRACTPKKRRWRRTRRGRPPPPIPAAARRFRPTTRSKRSSAHSCGPRCCGGAGGTPHAIRLRRRPGADAARVAWGTVPLANPSKLNSTLGERHAGAEAAGEGDASAHARSIALSTTTARTPRRASPTDTPTGPA